MITFAGEQRPLNKIPSLKSKIPNLKHKIQKTPIFAVDIQSKNTDYTQLASRDLKSTAP
jgi:hypothetical protein